LFAHTDSIALSLLFTQQRGSKSFYLPILYKFFSKLPYRILHPAITGYPPLPGSQPCNAFQAISSQYPSKVPLADPQPSCCFFLACPLLFHPFYFSLTG